MSIFTKLPHLQKSIEAATISSAPMGDAHPIPFIQDLKSSYRGKRLLSRLFAILFLLAVGPSCTPQVDVARPEVKLPERLAEPRRGVDLLHPTLADRDPKLLKQRLEFDLLEHPTVLDLDRYLLSWELEYPKPLRLSFQIADVDQVRSVQRRLRELGYLHSDADIDGVLGEKTRLAAKRFEERLEATGELDPLSLSEVDRQILSILNPNLDLKTPQYPEYLEPLRVGDLASQLRALKPTSPDATVYQLHEPSQDATEQSLPSLSDFSAAPADPGVAQEEIRPPDEKAKPVEPTPPPGTDKRLWKQELKAVQDEFDIKHVHLDQHGLNDVNQHHVGTQFEVPHLNSPVDLNSAPAPAQDQAHPQFHYRVFETTSPDSIRYNVHDTSNNLIAQSVDRRQLAEKMRELLAQGGDKAISIELPSFSQIGADALASSLTIQLRHVDPALAVTSSSLSIFTPPDERLSTTPGLFIRRDSIVIERIKYANGSEQFSSTVSFGVRVANQVRNITVTFVHASLDLVWEFLDRIGVLRPFAIYERRSLKQTVDQARADLKKAHPGLTDLDFQVMVTDQAGNTGLVELRIETTFACS